MRSRLYLKRATVRDEGSRIEVEPDTNVRILTTMKFNYGPAGGEIRLRWQDGAFRAEPGQVPSSFSNAARAMVGEATFLDLVARYQAEGRHVSANPSANYAPAMFAKDQRANGMTVSALRLAINTLFASGKIVVEEIGPPSKRGKHIVVSSPATIGADP